MLMWQILQNDDFKFFTSSLMVLFDSVMPLTSFNNCSHFLQSATCFSNESCMDSFLFLFSWQMFFISGIWTVVNLSICFCILLLFSFTCFENSANFSLFSLNCFFDSFKKLWCCSSRNWIFSCASEISLQFLTTTKIK